MIRKAKINYSNWALFQSIYLMNPQPIATPNNLTFPKTKPNILKLSVYYI